MNITKAVSEASNCLRHHIGAVIVKDDVIISTGYNGSPRGYLHCDAVGCIRDKLNIPSGTKIETCMAIHAEQNAIIHASRREMIGGTIYVNSLPCITCSKMIINAGITKFVYIDNDYPDKGGIDLLKQMKIELVKI